MSNHFTDEILNIETPENVVFGFEVAGIGSRFLAALVDTTLLVTAILVVNITAFLMLQDILESIFGDGFAAWVSGLFGLLAFFILWGYYILFEVAWNGQSPGKRWVGLRVIRADGTAVSLAESAIRNLVRLVDFLPVFYGAGVVAMFINQQARRLGDLAAGTLVVYDRQEISLDSLAQKNQRLLPTTSSLMIEMAEKMPLEKLSAHDFDLAERLLARRHEYNNTQALCQVLLNRMERIMGLEPTTSPDMDKQAVLAACLYVHRNGRQRFLPPTGDGVAYPIPAASATSPTMPPPAAPVGAHGVRPSDTHPPADPIAEPPTAPPSNVEEF